MKTFLQMTLLLFVAENDFKHVYLISFENREIVDALCKIVRSRFETFLKDGKRECVALTDLKNSVNKIVSVVRSKFANHVFEKII